MEISVKKPIRGYIVTEQEKVPFTVMGFSSCDLNIRTNNPSLPLETSLAVCIEGCEIDMNIAWAKSRAGFTRLGLYPVEGRFSKRFQKCLTVAC